MKPVIGAMLVVTFLLGCCNARSASAAEKPAKPVPIAPAQELPEGWEKLPFDRRYKMLLYDLAQVNEELKALIQKQVFNVAGQGRAKGQARAADESIVRQWANGGGPVRWTKFYGRTSEEFYLPGPVSVAIAADGEGGVAAAFSRGSPTLKKRPPQFDYVEKAQVKIKADAAARAEQLAKNLPALVARRKELEARQIQLFSQIAFNEVRSRDLKNKQTYRYEPTKPESESETENWESLRAVMILMRRVVHAVDDANELEPSAFDRIGALAERSRVELTDAWTRHRLDFVLYRDDKSTKIEPSEIWNRPGILRIGLDGEATETRAARGQFLVLARLLEDQTVNLDELYAEALADAKSGSGSLAVKTERWDQLSTSLVDFGMALLTMDRTATELAKAWNLKPNLDRPLDIEAQEPSTRREIELDPRQAPVEGSAGAASPRAKVDLSNLREIKIRGQKRGKWNGHVVTHENGMTYVKLQNGKRTQVTLSGNTLTWQRPKGGEMRVDIVEKKTDTGNRVRLVFAD